MSWTDTHCHLDQLDDPIAAVDQAVVNDVGRIVAVSMDLDSMRRVLDLRNARPRHVLAGLGVHPQEIPAMSPAQLEDALAFVDAHLHEADLLGEVGLDFKFAVDETQQRRQHEALERQLEVAARLRRPINLHSRRAERATLNAAIAFVERSGVNAQLHWFSHSRKLVRRACAAGVYVSVGPSIVFDEVQRAVAAAVDPQFLLLETDSPVIYQGEPAAPRQLTAVGRVIADLWQCPLDEAAARLEQNFVRYLRSSPARAPADAPTLE